MRTIKLNVTYITTSGREFTPVEKASVKYLNEESRYIDAKGNRIKKSSLCYIKGETPVIRPQGTI